MNPARGSSTFDATQSAATGARAPGRRARELLAAASALVFGWCTAAAAQDAVAWERFTDPLEHAFAIDVPQGWRVEGGMARLSALNVNPFMRILSPDGGTYFAMGDPGLPSYATPTELMARLGMREGMPYSPGLGQRSLILRYLTGRQFAEAFVREEFGKLCRGLALDGSGERPDLARQSAGAGSPMTARLTGGEATFTCSRGDRSLKGYALAVTWLTRMGDTGTWTVDRVGGFVAPADRYEAAAALFGHMVGSAALDPRWVQSQQALTGQAVQQINQRIAEFEQQQTAIKARLDAFDRSFQAIDNIVADQNTYVDPLTNQEYRRDNHSAAQWVGPGGRTASTDRPLPPPGVGWRRLEPVQPQ